MLAALVSIHAPAWRGDPRRRGTGFDMLGLRFNPRPRVEATDERLDLQEITEPLGVSNPRPRVGGRTAATPPDHWFSHLQHVSIHAPVRRRLLRDVGPADSPEEVRRFQSTPRVGGRLALPRGLARRRSHDAVSIHAPRVGATRFRGMLRVPSLLRFNPRPPRGRATCLGYQAVAKPVGMLFQSTPPRGGRPGRSIVRVGGWTAMAGFNPRPRVGGRPLLLHEYALRRKGFQSTPPRGAASYDACSAPMFTMFQGTVSIHAPGRAGRRTGRSNGGVASLRGGFQSTPPAWERRPPPDLPDGQQARGFNPRPRVRGRPPRQPAVKAVPMDLQAFQSTPPRGGERLGNVGIGARSDSEFQSTPPRGEATPARPVGPDKGEVSIHAPAWATGPRDPSRARIGRPDKHVFNPRPRVGASDLGTGQGVPPPIVRQFQSTPPRAQATRLRRSTEGQGHRN